MLTKISISNGELGNQIKVGDFIEFSFKPFTSIQIDEQGRRNGTENFFKNKEEGILKWTVHKMTNGNITLQLEVVIEDYFSTIKIFNVSNNIATIDKEELGYIPFWIDKSKLGEDLIPLDGSVEKPLFGNITENSIFPDYLGGARESVLYRPGNSYFLPGEVGTRNYEWLYNKYTGMLVRISLTPVFWITLKFSYIFQGVLTISKTNLDMGPIEPIRTLLTSIGPLILVIPIVLFGSLTLIIYKIKKAQKVQRKNRRRRG
jgi:hypothetical protein